MFDAFAYSLFGDKRLGSLAVHVDIPLTARAVARESVRKG
jgi:hypothetical protein